MSETYSGALERLIEGNRAFRASADARRLAALAGGQQPWAIVLCCSDSRVVPEQIFQAALGELFVIRVAGNVLDRHQLGSVEYAAAHLGCKLIVMLGHSGCGAVGAALSGHAEGYISYITADILRAVGEERDPDAACRLNVLHGVKRLRHALAHERALADIEVRGAVYELESGAVEWLNESEK